MTAQQPPRKIGLMGPFGYGNLGDAAIQDAMIQNIRRFFPDAEIYGFSLNPEDTEARHGIKSYPISRMSWREDGNRSMSLMERLTAWMRNHPKRFVRQLERWVRRGPLEFGMIVDAFKALKGFDLFIISGGGQLDDYWGGGGPWSHPYTLLKWGGLARLRGAKFMFVSVGAGPLDAKLSRLFIRSALSIASYRSYRDEYSRQYVARVVGFQKDDPVYPDLAFSLHTDLPEVSPIEPTPRKIVGIGPVGYFREGCWPEADAEIYAHYLHKLATFVEGVIHKQYAIVFLPGETYYDQLAMDDLKQVLALRGVDLAAHILDVSILTVTDLLVQIQRIDFVVVSRFHNLLLSQLLNKPALALSYQAKIDSLMASTEQAQYCFPIQSFDEQVLLKSFADLEAQQEVVRQQVRTHIQQYRDALQQQYERIFK